MSAILACKPLPTALEQPDRFVPLTFLLTIIPSVYHTEQYSWLLESCQPDRIWQRNALESGVLIPHLPEDVRMTSPIFETIKTTRSIRKFTDQPLPDDVMREILEAGRRSGSSKNDQPWQFIAIRD